MDCNSLRISHVFPFTVVLFYFTQNSEKCKEVSLMSPVIYVHIQLSRTIFSTAGNGPRIGPFIIVTSHEHRCVKIKDPHHGTFVRGGGGGGAHKKLMDSLTRNQWCGKRFHGMTSHSNFGLEVGNYLLWCKFCKITMIGQNWTKKRTASATNGTCSHGGLNSLVSNMQPVLFSSICRCFSSLWPIAGTGLKWNFQRGCIPIGHPESTQGCTDSAEIYSCITACDTDLCNTGDGLPPGSTLPPPPGGGDGNHGGGNKGDNGASAVAATLTSFVLLPVAFILRF